MTRALLLLVAAVCITLARGSAVLKPVIGIVTQDNEQGWPAINRTYIAASYVKFIESAGARVVPVFIHRAGEDGYLDRTFSRINGVLFPGGGQDLNNSPLLHVAQYFVTRSIKSFATGDYFPVFGHCQGFEVMLMAITGRTLEQCMVHEPLYVAENVSLPLFNVSASSRWFANMPSSVKATLTQTPSTLNNHMWSTPLALWASLQQSTPLGSFRIVSTTVSQQGGTFVSNYEHVLAPVYAMQFHAEKPLFEWPNENINHSRQNVRAMQFFSNFVVDEASKSGHVYDSNDNLNADLIYNFSPVFSIAWANFEQLYYFSE